MEWRSPQPEPPSSPDDAEAESELGSSSLQFIVEVESKEFNEKLPQTSPDDTVTSFTTAGDEEDEEEEKGWGASADKEEGKEEGENGQDEDRAASIVRAS